MKTTDSRDPLDQKIDKLLASHPVKAPTDFSARTLAAVEAAPKRKKPGKLAPLIRFALPLAAAIALAFILFGPLGQDQPEATGQLANANAESTTATSTQTDEALSNYEIQEILMLQEGLTGFAQIESDELDSSELLETLDTLYSI